MDEEYLYLNENHRLGWGYDDSPENPRESWDMMTGFVTIEHRPRHFDVTAVHDDPTGRIKEAHERFENVVYERKGRTVNAGYGYWRDVSEITARWARIFHTLYIEWDDEYQGYWFVDPDAFAANWRPGPDGLIQRWDYPNGVPTPLELETVEQVHRDIIKGERDTYNCWAKGEVYYVFGQVRRIETVEVSDPLSGAVVRTYQREEWETTDSLSGIYQDGYGETFEDMVKSVARENFGDEYTAA